MLSSTLSDIHPATIAIAILVAYILSKLWSNASYYRKINRLGGRAVHKRASKVPWGIDILIADLKALRGNRLFEHYRDLLIKYNHTMEIQTTGDYAIVTDEPENLQAILAGKFEDWGKGPIFLERWKPFLGLSIFTTDGPRWKSSRKLLVPQFNVDRSSDLECYERSLNTLIGILSDAASKGEAVDMSNLITRYTLDVSTDFLFGDNLHTLQDPDKYFAWAFDRIGQYQFSKSMLGGFSRFFIDKKELEDCISMVDKFLADLVQQALNRDIEDLKKKSARQYSLLDALAVNTRDPQLLRDHLVTVLWATRDTGSAALTWAMYEISRRPEILAKLREEVLSAVGPNRPPTYDSLKKLTYTKQFINEILRLYPSVPFNVRHSLSDTTLPAGGYGSGSIGVPKGCSIVYSIMALHRRKDIYGDDADEFKPERWDNGWSPKPWAYIPFNGGPRICLGQTFAMVQLQYTLARIVQAFSKVEYKQEKEQGFAVKVTLQPEYPIMCLFKR